MSVYIINLGSNLGQRRLFLSRAMKAIGDEFGSFEMSHAFETEAEGYESERKFLNLSMMFHSDLQPEEVLTKLQSIESEVSQKPHRSPDGTYCDRELDIDIIAVDDKVISTDRLKVPHHALENRESILRPLAEIAPSWRNPLTGLTARETLENFLIKNAK